MSASEGVKKAWASPCLEKLKVVMGTEGDQSWSFDGSGINITKNPTQAQEASAYDLTSTTS